MSSALRDEILEQVDALPPDAQRSVLEYARTLATPLPPGMSGKELLGFVGMFDPDDARRIAEAIEEECERIDLDGW